MIWAVCSKRGLCSVTQKIKSHLILPKTTSRNQAMPTHDFVMSMEFFFFKPPLLRLMGKSVLNLKSE